MKNLLLILGLIGAPCSASEQDSSKTDLWSGTYALRFVAEDGSTPVENSLGIIIIERSKSDPGYWISFAEKSTTDGATIEELSFGLDGEEDDYEEFGWTELHRDGKMNCISIEKRHAFIFQTQPNTTVRLREGSFFSRTGIFGVQVHAGLFEFERIAPKRR